MLYLKERKLNNLTFLTSPPAPLLRGEGEKGLRNLISVPKEWALMKLCMVKSHVTGVLKRSFSRHRHALENPRIMTLVYPATKPLPFLSTARMTSGLVRLAKGSIALI